MLPARVLLHLALGLPRIWLKSSNTLLSREESAVKSCINPLRDFSDSVQLLSDAVTDNSSVMTSFRTTVKFLLEIVVTS